jgi:hypothetical protein
MSNSTQLTSDENILKILRLLFPEIVDITDMFTPVRSEFDSEQSTRERRRLYIWNLLRFV